MIEKVLQYLNSRPDKAMHFSGGYILATVSPITPMWGLAMAVLAGIVKEIYDSENADRHSVDKFDTFATCLGGATGYIALIIK